MTDFREWVADPERGSDDGGQTELLPQRPTTTHVDLRRSNSDTASGNLAGHRVKERIEHDEE